MMMIRFLFIFVLTVSVEAQQAPNSLLAKCGSLPEFMNELERHCSSIRAKRNVLDESVSSTEEQNRKETGYLFVIPDLLQQLKTPGQHPQQHGTSAINQEEPDPSQQLVRSDTLKKLSRLPRSMVSNAIRQRTIGACCADVERCLRSDAIRRIHTLVCERTRFP